MRTLGRATHRTTTRQGCAHLDAPQLSRATIVYTASVLQECMRTPKIQFDARKRGTHRATTRKKMRALGRGTLVYRLSTIKLLCILFVDCSLRLNVTQFLLRSSGSRYTLSALSDICDAFIAQWLARLSSDPMAPGSNLDEVFQLKQLQMRSRSKQLPAASCARPR